MYFDIKFENKSMKNTKPSKKLFLMILDCSNEEQQKSHLTKYAQQCKNYTVGQPTIIVVDGSGRLGNHIWNYVFMLAVQVRHFCFRGYIENYRRCKR